MPERIFTQARAVNFNFSAAIQICASGANWDVKNNPAGLSFTLGAFQNCFPTDVRHSLRKVFTV